MFIQQEHHHRVCVCVRVSHAEATEILRAQQPPNTRDIFYALFSLAEEIRFYDNQYQIAC